MVSPHSEIWRWVTDWFGGAWMQREVIGQCALYCGDCRDVVPGLPTSDAMVTDPPYGINLTGKGGHYRHGPHAKLAMTYASYDDTEANFHAEIVPRLREVLPSVRSAAVFMASKHIWALPAGDLGGIYLPNGCGIGPWGFQCFMHVVLYGEDPYLTHGKGCIPNGRYGLYGNDSNTIAHPCAKPVAAMEWAVNRISFPDESILDPFMGSGTTGVGCVKLGRRFIGIEIEPQYFDLACQRIEEACRQGDLFVSHMPSGEQIALLKEGS